MNKTLAREYKVGSQEAQDIYDIIKYDGSPDMVNEALEKAKNFPVLNIEPVWVRNRKGVVIALVCRKGYIQKLSTDFMKKVWYFDGNRIGKKKRLLAEAYYSDELLNSLNYDDVELDKVWKKIKKRVDI